MNTHAVRRYVRGQLLVTLLIIGFVFAQSYDGRLRLVESQRAGCARGKLDRNANADGWWTAEQARMDTATDPTLTPRARSTARHAAERYASIAAELEARAGIDCAAAFPRPSPLP